MKSKTLIYFLTATVFNSILLAAEAPKPRPRSEVEAVLDRAPKAPPKNQLEELNVVLVAIKKDHGENEHDYPLWQKRWAVLLGGRKAGPAKQVNLYGPPPEGRRKGLAGAPKVNISIANGWPSEEQLKTADLIAAFCYVKYDEKKLVQLEKFLARGGGYVIIHPAVIVPKDRKDLAESAAKLMGLTWEHDLTRWRHGEMNLKIEAPDHPICLGLPETIHVLDEPYWPLKGDRSKVTILATSAETISKESEQTRPEPMFYTYEYGKGRVFTCILGHYTWTFDDPYVRILLLRGMAWAAGESPYRFDRLVMRGIELSGD